jgi:pyridoxal phosphate enzyme (YggS family)
MTDRIADNLAQTRERISRAAIAAKRDPATIRLVAVSKTKPVEAIRDAYEAGQRDFGENYAQELSEKASLLHDLPDLRWHFIGHLQSNKAKLVAPITHLVHAVDSPSLVRELSKRRGATPAGPLPLLVEVNVAGEAEKHGVDPRGITEVLAAIEAEPNVIARGLMTMPPNDLEAARAAFTALSALRDRHGGAARLPELSMGMSSDLEIAIECGATIVRVGTAIFGER